jgi:hypothetical protein
LHSPFLTAKFLISVTLILVCVQLASRLRYKAAGAVTQDVLILVFYSNITLLRQSSHFS